MNLRRLKMTMFQSGRNVKNLDSFKGLEERIDNIQGIEVEEVKTEEVKVEETPLKDVDLVFLLDKSGSMYSAVSDTIGGFNSFIEKERKKNPKTHVTCVLFDTEFKVLYARKPITEVDELTEREYFADGCTALLDAIGTTVNRMEREVDNDVLFVITTDGLENSSREFSKSDIKNMIANKDWEFLFIGADIDSYEEAFSLGIDESRAANYEKSSSGIAALFDSVGDAHDEMTRGVSLSSRRWKRRLG